MNRNKASARFITIIILSFSLASCASLKTQEKLQFDKSYCNQSEILNYTEDDLPIPLHNLKIDTVLTNRFSYQSLNAANAIKLLDLLTKYVDLNKDYHSFPTIEKKVELVSLLQKINQRINLSSLEISGLASELDCEEERADQFAYFLKEKEGDIETRLVIGSIIVGAAGSILSEVLSNTSSGNASSNVAIGASIIEATFGVLLLTNKKKIEFYHKKNALKDIWMNPAVSNYYPPAIWYYLTNENPAKNEKSLAKLLVEKWLLFGQIETGEEKSKRNTNELFFGEGGNYKSDQLKNRADMLDQIESYITLMKQDLKVLSAEIEKLNED